MSTSTFPEWDKIIARNTKRGGMVIRQPANQHGAYKACPTCEGSGRVWVENGEDEDGYQGSADDLTDAPQLDHLSARPGVVSQTAPEWLPPHTTPRHRSAIWLAIESLQLAFPISSQSSDGALVAATCLAPAKHTVGAGVRSLT